MRRSRWVVGFVVGFSVLSGCESTDDAPGSDGAATGGRATGGTATGGTTGGSAGNASSTGGTSTGGRNSAGGNATGGRNSAGGASTAGTSTGGRSSTGGTSTGGTSTGGTSTDGGSTDGGSTDGGSPATSPCDDTDLVWKSANKTNYTSYPDPGSEECIEFNGCEWAGQFAACDEKKSEAWVAAHNIVAAFPDFADLRLHDLCLRKGSKVLVVTVLDTCADSDCDGCCSENLGSSEQLIDLESATNERWGVSDGPIEWADLGPTTGEGCE